MSRDPVQMAKDMTLRDYFAAKVVTAIVPAWTEQYCAPHPHTGLSSAAMQISHSVSASGCDSPEWLAETAYDIADAMIAAREGGAS